MDRDECRFAQASRQMFEAAVWPAERLDLRVDEKTGLPAGMHAGGWVVPMVATTPRLNKPPLVYWLQVASAWVMTGGDPERDAIWMYRLPSLLCAAGTVLITWRVGLKMFDARVAWLAGGLLAVCPMVVWDAHQARADQLLTICTAGAMACLWALIKRERVGAAVGLWVCVGLGVMAKGFITPLVVVSAVMAVCAAERSLRVARLTKPLMGLAIVALVVAPWVWLLSRQVGLEVYGREVWREVFLRAATGAKDGGRSFLPPGTHVVLLGLLFWPGCLLVWPAVGRAVERAWGGRTCRLEARTTTLWARVRARIAMLKLKAQGRRAELFLLAWLVPTWIVFELSPAKLPHYTMPLYPAVALLAARELFAAQARLRVGGRLGVWGWVGIGALLPLAAAAAVWVSDSAIEGKVGAVVFVIGLIGLPAWGALLVAVQFVRGHRWVSASVAALCACAFMLALALHAVAPVLVRAEKPKLLTGNLTQRLFDRVRAIDPKQARPLASVYGEDSVVFQSRGRVEKITPAEQAKWLDLNPAGILIGTPDAEGPGRNGWLIGNFAVLAPRLWSDGKFSDPPPPAWKVKP